MGGNKISPYATSLPPGTKKWVRMDGLGVDQGRQPADLPQPGTYLNLPQIASCKIISPAYTKYHSWLAENPEIQF